MAAIFRQSAGYVLLLPFQGEILHNSSKFFALIFLKNGAFFCQIFKLSFQLIYMLEIDE